MNNDNDLNSPELLSEHLRESLSALVDGELSTTEAAFLIKRMAHDAELNAQWQRFQGIGEVLRGQAQALDSDNFSARILSKIANADIVNAGQKAAITHASAATSLRFNRQSLGRFGAGIAIAAAVAWAALLLPQRFQVEIAPQATAQTAAPLTLASPVVSMRTVSGHIGTGAGSSADQNNALLAQSMDAFLLEHVQRSPISPISDAVYLPSLAMGDTAELSLTPQ
jgi:negative regulator of sigma E activity